MELQEIEVFIDSTGKVQLAVRGVKGGGCLDLTKQLEALLGGEVLDRKMSSEAYEAGGEVLQNQQRVGGA